MVLRTSIAGTPLDELCDSAAPLADGNRPDPVGARLPSARAVLCASAWTRRASCAATDRAKRTGTDLGKPPHDRYLRRMAERGPEPEPGRERGGNSRRFTEDLVGLDPNDPDAQAFAAHLDRIERPNCKATVEGTLQGVDDFAQCANRTAGHRRVVVLLVVTLILGGVLYTVWNSLLFMLETFLG